MRRGSTRALSRIRPEGRATPLRFAIAPSSGEILTKTKRLCAITCLLISLSCFAGETNPPPPNAIPAQSNALWLSFTNATPSDRRTSQPMVGLPVSGTGSFGSGAQLRIRSEMLRERLKQTCPALQAPAQSNRLGDYWLPGEFQRIIGRPAPPRSQ